jgi:CBS domain-containing protein
MRVSTILEAKGTFVATVTPDVTIHEALGVLARYDIGSLVVSDDGSRIRGIISERDIMRHLERVQGALSLRVSDVMSIHVPSATPDDHIDRVLWQMTHHRIRHVPILDEDGRLTGIVSIGDAVAARLREVEGERSALYDYITSGG